MARILPNERLLRVSQATKTSIDNWKEGVSLEQGSARTISELKILVVQDRWSLSLEHRRHANRLLASRPPLYRSAVSRYYYAMYHAMRSCVYVSHGGDDHEGHSKLPQNIPADFAPGEDWQTKLKDARLTRNNADYDPYPKSDKAFRNKALSLKSDCDRLLMLARNYLRERGCVL
jgi:uncharacterized protein (UPF0332 family)